MVSNSEALLGPYKDILRGETYTEKIENFFDCVNYAHERGYGFLLEEEIDLQDIRVILSTAGPYVKGTSLQEKLERTKRQIDHLLDRKNKKTLKELVEELASEDSP